DYFQHTNGNRVTAGYTGSRLTSLTDSVGNITALAYNAQGRISQITDPVGRITTFTYDSSGEHLLSASDPTGTIQIAYITGQGAAREHAVSAITFNDGTHEFFT